MHLDVLDLRNFYYRTGLGRVAQKAIRDQVTALWPDVAGQTVVGFGFAAPLLRPFLDRSRRVIALMPGQQGVMPWPAGLPNVSVLCEERHWPVETGRADRLILLHALDTTENPTALLQECWRVLGPGGRALVIVPNRAGLWARRDVTPFGFGRPYTMSQLEARMRAEGFVPERHASALYIPPSRRRFWLRSAGLWEDMGRRVSSVWSGGVLILEVSKLVHAPLRPGRAEPVRRPLKVLEGMPAPSAKPV